jgi:Xaa-Pro aminopeptidase
MDTLIAAKAQVRERIAALRQVLAQAGIDALLVPSSDPHLSEYLPEHWQARQWFSGFTGSMGTLVVTRDDARLFADSRYWVQAELELAGTGIELFKIPNGASSAHVDWIAQTLRAGQSLAVDGAVLGLAQARALQTALSAQGIGLRTDLDLVARAWPARPPLPQAKVYEHQPPQAASSRADKLAALRQALAAQGAQWHFVSTVDDIGYLLNLRGSDVDYNPVFIAHLLVGPDDATLFVGAGKVDADLGARLAADGVRLAPYEQAAAALAALPAGAKLLIDPRRITHGFRQAIAAGVAIVEAINPSVFAKSRKTDTEAAFVRETMERDGAAMCAFYAWFEQALARGERITELTVDERLSAERAKQPGFVSLSFSTIAGFNANGALPHYRATESSHAVIEGDGLLLIDSGGQYLGGTTDITRVWPIGRTSAAQRRDCTLVLKGMMALARARFPRGTKGPMLDALARAPIWAEGIDYGHGTGHGVGYFMNVHEGPQTISQALPEPHTAIEPGMITSDEPGIYREGQWGVRIENLLLAVPAASTPFGEFLEFETLTLCPIDTRLVERSLLRADEIDWLDAYHAEVRRRLAPHVSGDARAWLEARTQPLGR